MDLFFTRVSTCGPDVRELCGEFIPGFSGASCEGVLVRDSEHQVTHALCCLLKVLLPVQHFIVLYLLCYQMQVPGTLSRMPIAALATIEGSLHSSMTEAMLIEGGKMMKHRDTILLSQTCFYLLQCQRYVINKTWVVNHCHLCLLFRFDHGGFGGGGGGGGNTRWVEEARDDGDWSKPMPRNECLEQWVCILFMTSLLRRMDVKLTNLTCKYFTVISNLTPSTLH